MGITTISQIFPKIFLFIKIFHLLPHSVYGPEMNEWKYAKMSNTYVFNYFFNHKNEFDKTLFPYFMYISFYCIKQFFGSKSRVGMKKQRLVDVC